MSVSSPLLTCELDKIEHNARAIVELCAGHGIAVTGVTKGVCGDPAIAGAMLRGGVASIGDSHLENLRHLRAAGVQVPLVLLRVPSLSDVEAAVECADVSLNSELAVLGALSRAAEHRGRVHPVVVMVDLGDLREGVWADDLVAFVGAALRYRGVRITGIGTNLACFGAVAPSPDNMRRLVELAAAVERTHGMELAVVSGANSSGLDMIAAGRMPARVNHARIGEAILLGRETVRRRPWPGCVQDAFMLSAEVIEVRRKPSLPLGERCEDAFGRHPGFEDRGDILRALLNIGREDVDIEGLMPVDPGVLPLGGSSDYLVVDVTALAGRIQVGDTLEFTPKYGALLAAMMSAYVEKRYVRGGRQAVPGGAGGVR